MNYTCDTCGASFGKHQWPMCPHAEEMQRYAGPKGEIWAAKILRIEKSGPMRAYPSGALVQDDTHELSLEVANPMPGTSGQSVTVDTEWLAENEPRVGGYYCVDIDGNESFIAAGVFERHFRTP